MPCGSIQTCHSSRTPSGQWLLLGSAGQDTQQTVCRESPVTVLKYILMVLIVGHSFQIHRGMLLIYSFQFCFFVVSGNFSWITVFRIRSFPLLLCSFLQGLLFVSWIGFASLQYLPFHCKSFFLIALWFFYIVLLFINISVLSPHLSFFKFWFLFFRVLILLKKNVLQLILDVSFWFLAFIANSVLTYFSLNLSTGFDLGNFTVLIHGWRPSPWSLRKRQRLEQLFKLSRVPSYAVFI